MFDATPKHPELPMEPLGSRKRQSRINRYLREDSNMKKRSQQQGFVGVRASKTVQGPENKLKRILIRILREIRENFALYREGNNQRTRKNSWILKNYNVWSKNSIKGNLPEKKTQNREEKQDKYDKIKEAKRQPRKQVGGNYFKNIIQEIFLEQKGMNFHIERTHGGPIITNEKDLHRFWNWTPKIEDLKSF